MKFLMIHFNEAAVLPTDSADEEDPAETRERDEAVEIASRHPTARKGTFELRPFWQ